MKKLFFLVCVMMSAMLTFAQETKKVAILEVVDKEGNITYANKLILRSNLAKAITNTPGYEAYDRTDMDAILGEQNFQRTGMVSNDQIKRLGEMTGAKYVLVAEAAVIDANTMYITAKLLDVETARTEMTDNQMMGTTAKEIQRGCQALAANLIKPVVRLEQPKSVYINEASQMESSNAYIKRIDNKKYSIGGQTVDRKAYYRFLLENQYTCPAAYQEFRKGKRMTDAGGSFMGIGCAALLTGFLCFSFCEEGYSHHFYIDEQTGRGAGLFLMIGGGVLITTSIPLLHVGKTKKNDTSYIIYNNYCVRKKTASTLTLNLQASNNGIGLAMKF